MHCRRVGSETTMRPFLLLLSACVRTSEETCEDVAADFEVERERIQSCDAASE
jgi:hypothetical protein